MQDQGDEGEGKWEVSQGNKEVPRMLLHWSLCYKWWKDIQLNWFASSGCTWDFLQDFQGETSPQSNPWKGEMGINFLWSSFPSSIL